MKNKIRLSKSVVGMEEKECLAKVIDAGFLGMGTDVQAFENALKEYLGAKHAVCVNSGTAALHLALMAIGLQPGDEVLVQSLTFVASFQAIMAVGGTPVPCEILPDTCTIDLVDAGKKITAKTKAIMPVHYAGCPGALSEVYAFAGKHGLRVVEDAAHAFGSTYENKKIGSFGDVICFSFDGIKNITCGEGGVVVTADGAVAQFTEDARLLAVHKDTEKRYKGLRSWEFTVSHQGYRYHMSNLFAAIGLAQLKKFGGFKGKRVAQAIRYQSEFKGHPGIGLLDHDYSEVVPHIFPILVKNGKRDALREYLLSINVECGVHYYPNHLLEFFKTSRASLPVTDRVYGELLSIPLHPDLSDADQSTVISAVTNFIAGKDDK